MERTYEVLRAAILAQGCEDCDDYSCFWCHGTWTRGEHFVHHTTECLYARLQTEKVYEAAAHEEMIA
jgi:hypothetical protein